MPLDDYRATMANDPGALCEFEHLRRSAALELVLPWVTPPDRPTSDKLQYEQLGAVLSRYSNILVALWDGTQRWEAQLNPTERQGSRGGTAHVVYLRAHAEREAEGFRHSRLFADADLLDMARGGPTLQIVTPRIRAGGETAHFARRKTAAGDCIMLRVGPPKDGWSVGKSWRESSARHGRPESPVRRERCAGASPDRATQRVHQALRSARSGHPSRSGRVSVSAACDRPDRRRRQFAGHLAAPAGERGHRGAGLSASPGSACGRRQDHWPRCWRTSGKMPGRTVCEIRAGHRSAHCLYLSRWDQWPWDCSAATRICCIGGGCLVVLGIPFRLASG